MLRLYLDSRTFGVEYGEPYKPLAAPFDALTEYPFPELGFPPRVRAPQMKVRVIDHDNNKCATVILPDGQYTTVKWGYLYREVPLLIEDSK